MEWVHVLIVIKGFLHAGELEAEPGDVNQGLETNLLLGVQEQQWMIGSPHHFVFWNDQLEDLEVQNGRQNCENILLLHFLEIYKILLQFGVPDFGHNVPEQLHCWDVSAELEQVVRVA
jgi:hypothetical protein